MEKTTGLFNRYLFTQIGLDSGSLTSLGVVMHCFEKPGLYRGQVRRGDSDAGSFLLSVDAESPQMQVDIDLAHLAPAQDCCDGKHSAGYVVNPRGYAVFHVSDGPGGFHVLVATADGVRGDAAFDSRELHDGDMFAATILRPGAYAVANTASRARPKADLVVAYPQAAMRRAAGLPVQMVAVTERGFDPGRMRGEVTQSQVFQIKGTARIRIELEKADDGPSGPGPRHAGPRDLDAERARAKPDRKPDKPAKPGRPAKKTAAASATTHTKKATG